MTYAEWFAAVDAEVVRKTGLSARDLDDWCYRADYENKVTPKRSAARAIRNAKEAMGM